MRKSCICEPTCTNSQYSQHCRPQLYRRIPPRNPRMTASASPAQQNPAEYRNIFPRPNPPPALRTTRGRTDDGFLTRQAINQHICKATRTRAENCRQRVDDPRRKWTPQCLDHHLSRFVGLSFPPLRGGLGGGRRKRRGRNSPATAIWTFHSDTRAIKLPTAPRVPA